MLAVGANAAERAAAKSGNADQKLTAQQILERHAAACGGLEAWHKIQTMAWTGHIESGPEGSASRPFMMIFRRPEALRFEIIADGQRSARIFDGARGWRVRPASSGMPEVTDYTAEEISFAHDAGGLDGPLIDPQAKGISVALQGLDAVEGHRAYHFKVTFPSGHVHEDWIDARSFLELRYDRETRSAAGVSGSVSVYLRNYQTFGGLQIPTLIETGGSGTEKTDKMIIEKVALNPAVRESQFSRPMVPHSRHRGAIVDIKPPAGPGKPGP
jgi:hypothetical protein